MTRYSKKYMIAESLKVIDKYKIVFITDIMAYVPFSKALFYKKGLDKVEAIKVAIVENKVLIKAGLRQKWYKGSNAITQLALYKLIGTETERKAISNAQVEVKGKLKVETFKVGYDDDEEKPTPD